MSFSSGAARERRRASRPSALERMTQRRSLAPDERFRDLPPAVGEPPYRLALADVVGPEVTAEIAAAGAFRFHSVGDTGGHIDPHPQRRVVAAMAAELAQPSPPRFFFHLGDVVYPHGEPDHYRPQFHAAYADYTAPILAVPGNHDAENDRSAGGPSLDPFCAQFFASTPSLHDAAAPARPPSRQPNVYFALVHDWVRIVGLWANVPEGGQFAAEQIEWLCGELADAPADVPVIAALHQPVYSADVTHGGNLELVDLLDACAARAGRGVDAVFSGHAHVYERFTRRVGGRELPFIVAGAGGYPELHPLARGVGPLPARFDGVADVTLDAVCDDAHGFMTVTVGPGGTAEVVYTSAGPDGPRPVDRFVVRAPGEGGRARAT